MNLNELTDQLLAIQFELNPISATGLGVTGYDHRLPDYSAGKIDEALLDLQKLKMLAQNQSPQNQDDQIDLDLIKRKISLLEHELTSSPQFESNPLLFLEWASNAFFALMMRQDLTDQNKAQALSQCLQALPEFLELAKTTLRTPVQLWTKLAIEQAKPLVQYLKETVAPYLETQKKNCEPNLQNATTAIFAFAHHLESQKTKTAFAIGEDNFSYILKTFHGFDESPAAIRELGLTQVDELTRALAEQAETIAPGSSWEHLLKQTQNDHPSEQNLLESYQQEIVKLKKFLKEKDLVTIPQEESLHIIETPGFLQDLIPYAAYSAPTMFAKDHRGLFFVTPPKGNQEVLREHCNASYPLTALHEGYPGHHLQFATQRTLSSTIRKTYDVASYYEGWTLYCEEMLAREGYYTPIMRLYQLKDRLWRACRIVVDVSMHCFDMTDDEAARFLVDHARLSPDSARRDVNWYTQSPTVPMSYLYGTLKVDEIRQDYCQKGHSLKEFHDQFLQCGAIPLSHVRQILMRS